MNIQFPTSIATFFKVSNGADDSLLIDCFARDAVVRDEEHTYQGHAAIQSWLRTAQHKYAYRAEPLAVVQEGASVKVRANVTGTFPGSPAQLDYIFHVAGDTINALEIH